MKQVTVNREIIPIPDPPTLDHLLQVLAPQRPFAVAHNDEFIPRAAYKTCELTDGDRVEIVHPSAGG